MTDEVDGHIQARLTQPRQLTGWRCTTVSGQTLQGTIGSGCDFFAFNDLGRFSLYPQKVKGIEFRR
ncbi:MAG: hypothetical protein ACRDTF_20730 [Pseudonocardiaceae bacterium]